MWPALALVLWLALMCSGAAAQGAVQILRDARALITINGEALPPQAIELPLHWDASYRNRTGLAELVMTFDSPVGANTMREPHALFISRLGSAFEIELNGALLQKTGLLDGADDRRRARQPLTLSFPSHLLSAHNELNIRIRGQAGYRSGLSPVLVGPASMIEPIARRAELQRETLPLATSVFSVMVASFCALLWWQQREPLYGWASLNELLWAVVVADAMLERSPLPWPYWGIALLLLRVVLIWSTYAIAQAVYGQRPRAEYWSLFAVQAAVLPGFALVFMLRSATPLFIWYGMAIAVWLWVLARLAAQAWRKRAVELAMLVLIIAAALTSSIRGFVVGRMVPSLYGEEAWDKYVAALTGMTLLWIVSRRFRRARSQARQLNASLAERVEQKELELRDSFERLSKTERSRAVLAERERILRDMHDGVGSNLATAVRQLESGHAPTEDVVQTLRESMDHLKLSIDAMNLPAGDVNALLASLRYRLQPRIESAGLNVKWNVGALPLWAAGTDEAMRHLQFLLLEVISNVLQHARASTLRLATGVADDGAIRIELADDGCGMVAADAEVPQSLRIRAEAIGAVLSLEPAEPGTRVTVLLANTRAAKRPA